MTRIGRGFQFVLWFWLAVAMAQANVQVTGSVDRNEMSVGDTFTYTVSVTSDTSISLNDPRLPKMDHFELLNTWTGTESRSTFANGTFQVQQTKSFNYMLATKAPGQFTLGAADVIVDGKPYRTQPITIKVLPAGQLPPQAQQAPPSDTIDDMEDLFNQLLRRRMNPGTRSVPGNPEDLFFIQAEADKKKAYVGEQITGSWYLYTRGQIHDIDTLKYPSLSGFWKEEIELATRLNFQQETVNGIIYQRALLASYALFAIKPGKAVVDAYKAKCTVSVPAAFGFSRPFQFTKASQPIEIEVMNLPTEGKPATFTGGVGRFEISAAVDQTNVAAHQPIGVKLRIQGRGNAKLIDLPPLTLPNGFELMDTKTEAKFFRDGNSYKEFQLTLVPRQAGQVNLGPIEVAAFDPAQEKYYVMATQPLLINVLPSSGPQAGLAPQNPMIQPAPQEPTLPPLDLDWSLQEARSPFPAPLAWVVVYALVLAILAWRAAVDLGLWQRRRDLKQLFYQRYKHLQAALDQSDWRRVGTEGTNLLYFVLGEISGEGGANLEMEKMLLKAPPSFRRELGEDLRRLLSRLEMLSFAPESLIGALKEKKELKKLVGELEKCLLKAIQMGARSEVETDTEESRSPGS